MGRENSLAKDLVDLVLLIEQAKMDAARVAKAISDTFQRRKTHNLPTVLAHPPESWAGPFSEMASECGIVPDIGKHFAVVEQFFKKLRL